MVFISCFSLKSSIKFNKARWMTFLVQATLKKIQRKYCKIRKNKKSMHIVRLDNMVEEIKKLSDLSIDDPMRSKAT